MNRELGRSRELLLSSKPMLAAMAVLACAVVPAMSGSSAPPRLTGSVNVGPQMMDRILDTFKRAMPEVPEEIWTAFRSECDPRELEDAILPLYVASFNDAELDAMLLFYHSPVGEKLLRKQPEIFRASGQAGQQWAADLTFRLRARLAEKGYPPPGGPPS